jgi:hypothetical protein
MAARPAHPAAAPARTAATANSTKTANPAAAGATATVAGACYGPRDSIEHVVDTLAALQHHRRESQAIPGLLGMPRLRGQCDRRTIRATQLPRRPGTVSPGSAAPTPGAPTGSSRHVKGIPSQALPATVHHPQPRVTIPAPMQHAPLEDLAVPTPARPSGQPRPCTTRGVGRPPPPPPPGTRPKPRTPTRTPQSTNRILGSKV